MIGLDTDIRNDCMTCALSGLCGGLCEQYQAYRRAIKRELERMPKHFGEHFSVELHCKLYRARDLKPRVAYKDSYIRRMND